MLALTLALPLLRPIADACFGNAMHFKDAVRFQSDEASGLLELEPAEHPCSPACLCTAIG
jgi:hypothetical protein